MEFVIHIVMYAWAYLCPPIHMCSSQLQNYTNTNLHGKLPPLAPNVNALVFIVCIIAIGLYCVLALILGILHAALYHGMCISIFQQITKCMIC